MTLIVTDFRNGEKYKLTEKDIGKTIVDGNGVTNIVVTTATISDGKMNTVIGVAPVKRSVERRHLEPEATKRLHDGPIVISSLFEASGKAEHKSYGKTVRGSYLYNTTVVAQSEVKEKEADEQTGTVRVVERRKFLQSRDSISLTDVDVAIALDTLPVDQVRVWVDNACNLVGGASAIISSVAPLTAPFMAIAGGSATTVKATVASAFATLYKIDGVSARTMLGAFGVEIPQNLEDFANKWVSQKVKDQLSSVHNAIQSIEGKAFLITYTQNEKGLPLKVDYANEDGTPITDAEWEILRAANVFLDSNVVPDTRCRVGDAWMVWADEVQELFGAAGEGRVEGKIRVERGKDQPNGDWSLQIEPAEIQFRTSDGTAAGKMQVKDGNGLVDAKNASVKSLQATATGNLRSLNKKRHFLFFDFVKRFEGNSNLRFTLTANPAAAKGE
jgi:hypothetical protein